MTTYNGAHISERCGGNRRALFLLCVFLALPFASAHAATTADPEANQQTKDTLTYLSLITQRANHRTVFGQMAIGANAPLQGVQEDIDPIVQATKLVPGMIGADYGELHEPLQDTTYFHALNEYLIAYAKQGSLITIGYHGKNPWTGGAWNDARCEGSFDDLINPEKPVHAAWMKQMDQLAGGLQELQAHGVTVLWRPFLEMNSVAAWWWQSCKATHAQFTAVWADMFNYFTTQKGLHNLLWVYAPVTYVGENRPALELYPGSGYVDIAGYDTYHDNADFPDYYPSGTTPGWNQLGKVLAYPERGPHETDGTSQVFVNLLNGIEQNNWNKATDNLAATTTQMPNLLDGWYLCTLTFTPAQQANTLWIALDDNSWSYAGNGISRVNLWLPQQATAVPLAPNLAESPWVSNQLSVVSSKFSGPNGVFDALSLIENTANKQHALNDYSVTGHRGKQRPTSAYTPPSTRRQSFARVVSWAARRSTSAPVKPASWAPARIMLTSSGNRSAMTFSRAISASASTRAARANFCHWRGPI